MAVLTLVLAAVATSSLGDAVSSAMGRLGYKKLGFEMTRDGSRFVLAKDVPLDGLGGQGGNVAGKRAQVIRPTKYRRDEISFIVTDKQITSPTWPELKHFLHLEPAYLGRLGGEHLYAKAPLAEMVSLKKTLGMSGGEDWRDLAIKGLKLKQQGDYDYVNYFSKTGDSSLPFLKKALEEAPESSWYIILSIGESRGEKSTDELLSLYHDGRKGFSSAAGYALIHEPFRPEAKTEYLDLLAQSKYIESICKAALQFDWKDAVPVLEQAMLKPGNASTLVTGLEAHRTLRGMPTSAEVRRAYEDLLRSNPVDPEGSKSTLLTHPDQELAAAYAYRLKTFTNKPSTKTINEAGQDLLNRLPKDVVESILVRFKREN